MAGRAVRCGRASRAFWRNNARFEAPQRTVRRVDITGPLVNEVYKSYGSVNSRTGGRHGHRHREQHRSGRVDRGVEGPQALPVADRAGGAVAGVRGAGDAPPDRLVGVVLDRPDRHPRHRPGDRPDDRPRPLQPARRRDRGPGAGPLLPLDHLPLPAHPVRRVRHRVLADRHRRPRLGAAAGAGHLDRRDRWHRHQHRPRARPQAREPRALAVQGRAGAGVLRPLLHRAQPRSPRPGGHPGGPGQLAGRRELLPVLAAHGLGLPARAPGGSRSVGTPAPGSTRSGSATTCSTPG